MLCFLYNRTECRVLNSKMFQWAMSIPVQQEEESSEAVINNETVNEESSENSESDGEVGSDTEETASVEKNYIETNKNVDRGDENVISSEDSDDQVEEVQGDSEEEKSSGKDLEHQFTFMLPVESPDN